MLTRSQAEMIGRQAASPADFGKLAEEYKDDTLALIVIGREMYLRFGVKISGTRDWCKWWVETFGKDGKYNLETTTINEILSNMPTTTIG